MSYLVILFLLASFALSPVYIWESGLPQISHIFASVAILIRLLYKPRIKWNRFWALGTLFVLYSFVVDIIIFSRYGDIRSMLEPAQYAFDFAVFVLLVSVIRERGRRILRKIFWLHMGLLIFQTTTVLLGNTRVFGSTRAMGFFNDPNQMSYWALWTAIIIGSTGKVLYSSWLPGYLALLLAGAIDLFSASRSAALGLAVLALVYVYILIADLVRTRGFDIGMKTNRAKLILIVGSILLLSGVTFVVYRAGGPVALLSKGAYLVQRFGEHQYDDTLSGRGYDRLWKFPEYLLFGAGQGAFKRYSHSARFLGEIHSTWAGVLFNYGVTGFVILLGFLFGVLRKSGYPFALLALPPFVYGFATFGLRNWYFWVGLAVIYSSSYISFHQKRRVTE